MNILFTYARRRNITDAGKAFDVDRWRRVAEEKVSADAAKVTKENYATAVKNLAELQKEYDSRGFFAKRNSASVGRQREKIDRTVAKIATDTGLEPDVIRENVRLFNAGKLADAKTMIDSLTEEIEDNGQIKNEAPVDQESFRASLKGNLPKENEPLDGNQKEKVSASVLTQEKSGPSNDTF